MELDVISVRARNGLKCFGIETEEALLGFLNDGGLEKLKTLPGFGKLSLNDVKHRAWLLGWREEPKPRKIPEPRQSEIEAARRRGRALRLRNDGLTFRAIGAELGVSGTRAQQMVARAERDLRTGHWQAVYY